MSAVDINWSDELQAIHAETSRDHFIDVLTRGALLHAVRDHVPSGGVVLDLGCSAGYLLADLYAAHPSARLVGVDLVEAGLHAARDEAPSAALLLADVRALGLPDGAADAIVSANVLEHVADHAAALREMYRLLVPGGRAALVVPAGPGLYDYYDAYLDHERRYPRGELAALAREAGFSVALDTHLGAAPYPLFWAVKKLNRARFGALDEADRRARVQCDIARTRGSRVGELAGRAELALLRRGARVPVGIRNLVVVDRP